jgi:WD40 repeat protein
MKIFDFFLDYKFMENNEEFFDAFETLEQLNSTVFGIGEDDGGKFYTDRPRKEALENIDLAEFKTDTNIPETKTELFSWTTLNLVKKHNKDICEFSGLEIIQEMPTLSSRNWVLKPCPNGKYFICAGESPTIQLFNLSSHIREKSLNLLQIGENYIGHEQSIVSVEWASSSDHFLSCGIDCLVLLWRVGHTLPIKQFLHEHIVTCLGFSCESLFFTGSLSKKLQFWSLPEGKLLNTYQPQGLVTSAKLSPDGRVLAVGTSQGECIFYEVNNAVLTFMTQIQCKNRKGFKSSGKKVTGIEFQDDCYVLISTNDSRIRLFSLENFELVQKYKGGKSEEFPLPASFSQNFGHVIRGSEDGQVHIWNTLKTDRKRWKFLRNEVKNSSFEVFTLKKEKSCSNAVFLNRIILKSVQDQLMADKSEVIVSHILIVSHGGKLFVLFNQFKNVPW